MTAQLPRVEVTTQQRIQVILLSIDEIIFIAFGNFVLMSGIDSINAFQNKSVSCSKASKYVFKRRVLSAKYSNIVIYIQIVDIFRSSIA